MPRNTTGKFLEGAGAAASPIYNALVAGNIPSLAASKITSGQFGLPRMPRGPDGHVLTGTGAGSDPAYEEAAVGVPGIWTLLTTLNPSNVSTINTGTIAARDMWMILMELSIPVGAVVDEWLNMRFNDDEGVTNYGYRAISSATITRDSTFSRIPIMGMHRSVDKKYTHVAQLLFSGKSPNTGINDRIGVSIQAGPWDISALTGINGHWICGTSNITKMIFFSPLNFTGKIRIYYMDY